MFDHPTLIFDLGSYNIKAGNRYDYFPQIIQSAFPAGQHDYPVDKNLPLDCIPDRVISKGEIVNEDRLNFILATVFDKAFPSNQPEPDDIYAIINFPPFPSRKHIEKIGFAMFEILSIDSIIIYPSTYMSQVQFAFNNSICVDVGYDITQVATIENNQFYPHSSLKSYSAGASLDFFTSFDQFNIREYKTWEQMEQARQKKEKDSVCSLKFEDDITNNEDIFPFICGELLFNPKLYESISMEEEDNDRVSMLIEQPSVAEIIKNSIELCHENNRKTMWNNIIVTGGTTQMNGFRERLKKDLLEIAPVGAKPRLIFPENPQTNTWEGGQKMVLTNENWLNIKDYEEDPDSIFNRFVKY